MPLILATLLALFLASTAQAVVRNITACTHAALVTAHTEASDGDILKFPSCTPGALWDNPSGSPATITKAITIQGNGMTGATHNTHIKRAVGDDNGPMIRFQCGGVSPREIAVDGIKWEGKQAGNEQLTDIGIHVQNCVNFRVKNNLFTHLGIGVSVTGDPEVMRGVIYDNQFIKNAVYTPGLGYGVEVRGNTGWPALALGTLANTFIEDNYFEANRHSVESVGGSRYVVRYNTFLKGRINSTAVDAHGPSQSAYVNGSRQWEVYNNLFDNTGSLDCFNDNCFGAIGMRGGDGTIFNNVIDNNGSRETVFWIEDFTSITNPAYRGCTCTPYPCRSQWSNIVNQTTDAHIWDNSPDDDIFFKGDPGSCHRTLIQEGRDYELFARPNYELIAIGGEFPPGKARVYPRPTGDPVGAPYPHPLRDDPPSTPPGPPQNVTITPIP